MIDMNPWHWLWAFPIAVLVAILIGSGLYIATDWIFEGAKLLLP